MNRRSRLTHGPRTWALAREDYLAGDSGPVVCRRYGIRLDALRARITREGWSKQKHAVAVENARLGPEAERGSVGAPASPDPGMRPGDIHPSRPPSGALPEAPAPADPRRAVQTAVRQAAAALKAGRALEAQTLVKAAEGLARLSSQIGPLPVPEEPWEVELRQALGQPLDPDAYAAFMEEVWAVAGSLAREMLAAAPEAPALHARAVYGWRARHLSAETVAKDKARAKAEGWWAEVYRPDGRPLPPPDRETLRRYMAAMVRDAELGPSAPPS